MSFSQSGVGRVPHRTLPSRRFSSYWYPIGQQHDGSLGCLSLLLAMSTVMRGIRGGQHADRRFLSASPVPFGVGRADHSVAFETQAWPNDPSTSSSSSTTRRRWFAEAWGNRLRKRGGGGGGLGSLMVKLVPFQVCSHRISLRSGAMRPKIHSTAPNARCPWCRRIENLRRTSWLKPSPCRSGRSPRIFVSRVRMVRVPPGAWLQEH